MGDQDIGSEIVSGAAKVLQPTLAASVFNTFRKATAIVLFLAWQLALPVELILHRRIGKRYMNTFFFVVAMIGLTILAELWIGGIRPSSVPSRDDRIVLSPRAAGKVSPPSPAAVRISSLAPFAWLTSAAGIAFLCHYLANRGRFGTERQGHSLDVGIPWLIYPPLAASIVRRLVRSGWMQAWLTATESAPDANTRRLLAYPVSQSRALSAMLRHHLSVLIAGEPPHGPLTWLVVTIVEPLALAGVGVIVTRECEGYREFGWYLGAVAAAMIVKGCIHAADWRERIYDDMDARLESEAISHWRSGRPATALSSAFTVPIAAAVPMLPRPSPAAVDTPPGFEELMADVPSRAAEDHQGMLGA